MHVPGEHSGGQAHAGLGTEDGSDIIIIIIAITIIIIVTIIVMIIIGIMLQVLLQLLDKCLPM
jgi:hypothetical protein